MTPRSPVATGDTPPTPSKISYKPCVYVMSATKTVSLNIRGPHVLSCDDPVVTCNLSSEFLR